MAGFVLVPLAACLVLAMFLVMERGRIAPRLPVDKTGAFFLASLPRDPFAREADPFAPRPWHELEGYDAHPEIPEWALGDLPDGRYDLPMRRRYYPRRLSAAQRWALSLDHAIARGDADALEEDAAKRHEALMEAYAANTAAHRAAADDAALDSTHDAIAAARAGSEYARGKWCAVLWPDRAVL